MTSGTRIVMAILGLDQHDGALKYVSHILRMAGMEIIYLGSFQTPDGVVKTAVQEDADAIGISAHSWEYIHYVPKLLALLRERELSIPVFVGGGILTESDEAELKRMGVNGVFRGGAAAEEIVASFKQTVKA